MLLFSRSFPWFLRHEAYDFYSSSLSFILYILKLCDGRFLWKYQFSQEMFRTIFSSYIGTLATVYFIIASKYCRSHVCLPVLLWLSLILTMLLHIYSPEVGHNGLCSLLSSPLFAVLPVYLLSWNRIIQQESDIRFRPLHLFRLHTSLNRSFPSIWRSVPFNNPSINLPSNSACTASRAHPRVRRAARLQLPPPNSKFKKFKFRRHDDIKRFTWFILQPKSATEIGWWLVH